MAEPVITVRTYKVIVLIMSLINYVTYQYTNATHNTPHKSLGESLQFCIALFLVCLFCLSGRYLRHLLSEEADIWHDSEQVIWL